MKETSNSYAWIVVSLLVLGIIILLATPFAETIKGSVGSNVETVGNNAEVVLENIKVESSFGSNKNYTYYTQENITALGDRATAVGYNNPLYVVGIYSNDCSEVILSRNGKGSNGIMKANAFADSENLTSAIVREGIVNIADSAFNGCMNLTDVYLPDGLLYIGYGAFRNTAIVSITIPDTVNTIEANAFSNCSNLREINFLGKSRPAGFYESDYPGVTVTYKN